MSESITRTRKADMQNPKMAGGQFSWSSLASIQESSVEMRRRHTVTSVHSLVGKKFIIVP